MTKLEANYKINEINEDIQDLKKFCLDTLGSKHKKHWLQTFKVTKKVTKNVKVTVFKSEQNLNSFLKKCESSYDGANPLKYETLKQVCEKLIMIL